MNLQDAYPSRFLKAADLPEEGSLAVTIEAIKLEEIGRSKETKPVLYFAESGTGFILNKTNARQIARLVGSEEFDDWIGRTIKLYRTEVDFQGEIVEAIRVRAKPEKPVAATKAGAGRSVPITQRKTAVPDEVEVDEDGIPF